MRFSGSRTTRPGLQSSRLLAVILLLSMTVGGIWLGKQSNRISDAGGIAVASSGDERELDPEVDPEEIDLLARGNNAFAFDLYRQISDNEGNIVFSPYSLVQVLAMVYAGAGGGTEQEMAAALHFDLDQERLHPGFNALDMQMTTGNGDDDGFQLRNVNALWGRQGSEYEEAFLRTLAQNYGAAMQLLDFSRNPASARLTINRWVSDRTEGRIEELIPPGEISRDTRLVLTNAIYFRALWEHPFDEAVTSEGEFTLRSGEEVDVPMMRQRATVRSMSERDFEVLELPYAGSDVAMLIILPDRRDFEAIEAGLSASFVDEVVEKLDSERLEIILPRFEFNAEFELSKELKALGINEAFSGQADFSDIARDGNLRLDSVRQKAFISVDEESTEAAAASSAGIVLTSLPGSFIADRPFIFLIRDESTGAILFVGRVDDPRG